MLSLPGTHLYNRETIPPPLPGRFPLSEFMTIRRSFSNSKLSPTFSFSDNSPACVGSLPHKFPPSFSELKLWLRIQERFFA